MLSCNRFLLNKDSLKELKKSYKKSYICEYFIFKNPCKRVIYQEIDGNYYKIIKQQNGKVVKTPIEKKEYIKTKDTQKIKELKKELYHIGKKSKLHVYKDIVILETEDEDILKRYKPYIKENILNPKKYSDYYIFLYSKQIKNRINIYKIFKKLKSLERVDMKSIIKSDMPIDDSVRVKLYELFIKLTQNGFELLKAHEYKSDMLKSYRANLIKIINILKEYKRYFDSDITQKVIDNLKYILAKTSIDMELNSVRANLKLYKDHLQKEQFDSFLSNEDAKITKSVEEFVDFLQTREYSIILKQLELLIKEKSLELSSDEIVPKSSISIKRVLKKRYKKLLKTIKKEIDCEDLKSYSKIYRSLQRLEAINLEFGYIKSEKKYYKRKQKISILKESLESFLYTQISKDLAENSLEEAKGLEALISKLEAKKEKDIKDIKKAIKKLKIAKKLFVS